MNQHPVWPYVEKSRDRLHALADRVWGMPEICYQETASVAEHIAELKHQGFAITENLADIPTAVMGEAGQGGPVIAFLGEYDALSGLSQQADIAEPCPVVEGGHGHGCGHNMLGAGAMLAAIAVRDWLAETGTKGRVRYIGCPAEEGGSAKAFMVKAGVFDDVDIAITWHPGAIAQVMRGSSLAAGDLNFTFTGRASHAAASPHLGRSALDGVEMMSVGVNYMREHMSDQARVHYAYLDAGGTAANVVQASAKMRYVVREPSSREMMKLIARVEKIAKGAALMSETSVEGALFTVSSELVPNGPLCDAMQKTSMRLARRNLPLMTTPMPLKCRPLWVRMISRAPMRWPECRRLKTKFWGIFWCRPNCRRLICPALPMWAMSVGWCRPCSFGGRITPSARRSIRGKWWRRARVRQQSRG